MIFVARVGLFISSNYSYDYFEADYKFSYLRTKDNLEVDLIVEKGKKVYLIEIKSTTKITEDHTRHLKKISDSFPSAFKIVACQEEIARNTEEGIQILPWQQVLNLLYK